MTTIAYNNGLFAYDSRVTTGMTITSDSHDKHHYDGMTHFFLAGSEADFTKLIDAYYGRPFTGDLEADGLVFDGDNLWVIGYVRNGGYFKAPVSTCQPYAIGSGAPHALTAMDMGATAKQAVEMAAKRNIYTGGIINEFSIRDLLRNKASNQPIVSK